jgi:DNA-binding NtrC family response regulator
MKYTILYIDEDPSWIQQVYQYFKDDFDVKKLQVDGNISIDNILETIAELNVDCVVTDYLLKETGEVDYNGNIIVDEIRKFKPFFPIIMLTAHEPEAVDNTEDVHIIYDKDSLNEESKLKIIISKIKFSIENYYTKIKDIEKRIEDLVKKRNEGKLKPLEEEGLTKLFIQLDELEPEGKDIPANLLTNESISKLNEFVNQTKEILSELKKNK